VTTIAVCLVWIYVGPIVALVFIRRPLVVGCFVSAPWFWCAWAAAECNDPLASLELFLVGAALLFVGLDIQWFRADPSRLRTR
jgi:hypothetical protein